MLTYQVNRVAMHYRLNNCPSGYNAQQCIVIGSHSETPECMKKPGARNDPWCYPMAKDVCRTGELSAYRGLSGANAGAEAGGGSGSERDSL